MDVQTQKPLMGQRLYFIDFLRIIAFLLLIFFHSAMPFVDYNWEVKNEEKSAILWSIVLWFHQWRLPLLFFISGVGISYSLRNRSVFQFLTERLKRLFIPLVFAMLFTIPIQVYVEYLQKGRIDMNYFEFYPSVWEFIPYPDGSLTWSHMWFVVYLIAFILILIPLFLLMKIRALEAIKIKFANYLSSPFLIYAAVLLIYNNYDLYFFRYPEQGNLIDDWFVFNSSLTYLLLGYLLSGDVAFWDNCERYRKVYFSVALIVGLYLFINYFLSNNVPKTNGLQAQVYFALNSIQIWSIILTAIGFAKKYLNKQSNWLKYLNQAVFPFFIIHQTIIVALGFWVVKLNLSIFPKYLILTLFSSLFIFGIYEYLIKRNKITQYLFGMKK